MDNNSMNTSISAATLWGGYLIEICLAFLLYGVILSQSYTYWLHRKRDPPAFQWIILTLIILEALHTAFLMYTTYVPLILYACDMPKQLKTIPTAGVCALIGLFVSVIVQLCYVRRIWILSRRSILLTFVPGICVIIRVGFGITSNAFIFVLDTWSQFHDKVGPMTTVAGGNAFSAVTDILIAGILIYLLHQNQSGFNESNHIVEKLILYIVQTGATTAIGSIIMIFLYVFAKDSMAFGGMIFMTSKLYTNSLLAMLNARQFLRIPTAIGTPEVAGHLQYSSHVPVIEIFQETTKISDAELGMSDVPERDRLSKASALA